MSKTLLSIVFILLLNPRLTGDQFAQSVAASSLSFFFSKSSEDEKGISVAFSAKIMYIKRLVILPWTILCESIINQSFLSCKWKRIYSIFHIIFFESIRIFFKTEPDAWSISSSLTVKDIIPRERPENSAEKKWSKTRTTNCTQRSFRV